MVPSYIQVDDVAGIHHTSCLEGGDDLLRHGVVQPGHLVQVFRCQAAVIGSWDGQERDPCTRDPTPIVRPLYQCRKIRHTRGDVLHALTDLLGCC